MYAKPRTKDPWSSCSFGTLYLICDSRLAEMEWHARHSYFVWRLAKMLPPLPDEKKTEGTEPATKDPPAVRDFHLSRTHCLPGEPKGRAWKSDIGSFVRDNQIAQRSFPTHWAAAIGNESAAYIAYL